MADEIRSARESMRQIEPFSRRFARFDMAAAYAVAQRDHQRREEAGESPRGRKIGFTNPDMWKEYGVNEPVWSHVYDTTVEHATSLPMNCSLAAFTEPKVEPEIVLHFAETPPVNADESAILRCIDWIAHAFEIVHCHFPGWQFSAADTVADSALHGKLIIGEPLLVRPSERTRSALASFSVRLLRDDTLVDTGSGAKVLGSPLAAAGHLIQILAQQDLFPRLRANELVSTGTLTAAHPVRAGETWCSQLQGIALPGLSVTFTE